MFYLYQYDRLFYSGPCSFCGASCATSPFVLARSLDLDRGMDGSIPPGLYDYAGHICLACADDPQVTLARSRDSTLPGPEDDDMTLEALDWLLSQTRWQTLHSDAIILPVASNEDLEIVNGRWVRVPFYPYGTGEPGAD